MGSHTITCTQGCTFDAPDHLVNQALALHCRIIHDYPEREACQHEWQGFSYLGMESDEQTCRLCGKRKMIFRAV